MVLAEERAAALKPGLMGSCSGVGTLAARLCRSGWPHVANPASSSDVSRTLAARLCRRRPIFPSAHISRFAERHLVHCLFFFLHFAPFWRQARLSGEASATLPEPRLISLLLLLFCRCDPATLLVTPSKHRVNSERSDGSSSLAHAEQTGR